MATLATAEALMARLQALASPAERDKPGGYGQSGGVAAVKATTSSACASGRSSTWRQSSSNGRDEVGLDARPRLHQDLVHHRAQQPLELLGGAVGDRTLHPSPNRGQDVIRRHRWSGLAFHFQSRCAGLQCPHLVVAHWSTAPQQSGHLRPGPHLEDRRS